MEYMVRHNAAHTHELEQLAKKVGELGNTEAAEQIIAEEVNVKVVEHGDALSLDKKLTPELEEEGFVRELIRFVQSGRKKAGLNVDDRIKLSVSCEVPEQYVETLKSEVLATTLDNGNYSYDEVVKVNGEKVTISLEKA